VDSEEFTVAASTTLTAQQRVLRARLAAYERWANEDGKANAQRAQAGLRDRFRREVAERYPDLTEAELDRRADSAYRAHMTRLALASSKARSARSRRPSEGASRH
jgi:hypothetical protein